ncbi:MAG: fibronectin type III domain-containing protein [Bacteroidales bacterium]|nr:fibronectin type III domain-containing protein [Bacteroidales bacterium]
MKKILMLAALMAALTGCKEKPVDPEPMTELGVPQNVVLHSATETSLTFQWKAVEGAGFYVWKLTLDGNAVAQGTSGTRNVSIPDLRKGTTYFFSVCAGEGQRYSPWSEPIEARTEGTAPEPGSDRICVDAALVLELDAVPVLGAAGIIRIFTSGGTEADRIDLADMAMMKRRDDGFTVPAEQLTSDSKFHTFLDALPCDGNWRPVHCTPISVDGKSLIVRPHSGVLDFDTEYYVTVDAGVIEGHDGIGEGEWKFTTAGAPSDASSLRVAADGSGDFCTIQRAIDFAAKSGAVISIANGTYHELLYARDKTGLTLKGESREGVRISYPNNESYENGSGSHTSARPALGSKLGASGGRGVFLVENCDNLTLQDLTLENSFGELKGQAEAIYFNSGSNSHRLTVENCSLLSYQDTFLCKGVVWVHNSLIAGHCDFIWGYPKACLFEDCEIRSRDAGYIVQARVQSASDKGFVFLNCRLTAEDGVKDGSMYLARSSGQSECWDNVTYIGCTMAPVIAPVGWKASPAPNPSSPTAGSGWKEYGSVTSSGTDATSGRNAFGKVLTSAEAAPYSSRQAVLGW